MHPTDGPIHRLYRSVQRDRGRRPGARAAHGTGTCTVVPNWLNLAKGTSHPIYHGDASSFPISTGESSMPLMPF